MQSSRRSNHERAKILVGLAPRTMLSHPSRRKLRGQLAGEIPSGDSLQLGECKADKWATGRPDEQSGLRVRTPAQERLHEQC